MELWHDFFLAQAGASAALAGLVFVGISINLDKILKYPILPGRALEAVILLIAVLFASTLLLVPGVSTHITGIELMVLGLVDWAAVGTIQLRARPWIEKQYRTEFAIRVLGTGFAAMAIVVAGTVLLVRGEDGLYWIVPGVLFSYTMALSDAWVLLVEINR